MAHYHLLEPANIPPSFLMVLMCHLSSQVSFCNAATFWPCLVIHLPSFISPQPVFSSSFHTNSSKIILTREHKCQCSNDWQPSAGCADHGKDSTWLEKSGGIGTFDTNGNGLKQHLSIAGGGRGLPPLLSVLKLCVSYRHVPRITIKLYMLLAGSPKWSNTPRMSLGAFI